MRYEVEPACRRMEWLDPFYKAVWEKAYEEAIPISGTFELTPRCNFNCRMCYVHLKPEQISEYGKELTAKEWISIAGEAKEAGTTWLCITGGEPLMHPEFEVIWRELTAMGFFITLQTNGSLIEGNMARLLEECPPKGVKITLYGSDDEVYERVCRVKGGFTKTDRGIQLLKELKIPVRLVSTIIRQNEEDVQRMRMYAMWLSLPWTATGSIRDSVRGADSEAYRVRMKEKLDAGTRAQIKYHLEKAPIDIERKPCTYCKDYRLGYWVTWNGDMRFCSFMNEPNIPVRDLAFSGAWKALVAYEEALDWPAECKSCRAQSACAKCAATLTTEGGSPRKAPESFCSKIKKYYDEAMKGDR
ncbi:MAG TPA: radical SAM protein [Candidatus Blautia pullicola]|uniref:Radical SAM protein n=1 Tax=Candidatus Blautia pullicola TaxID=2838498 RepID=A0A9D2FU79_9FIRM|nr:radical SAM protein [Candidatus Blautia pullicola]